jgi:hypothetical protein
MDGTEVQWLVPMQGLCRTRLGCAESNAKRKMEMNSLLKTMPTSPIPSIPTATVKTDVHDVTSSALRKSSRLAGKPRVVYYHVPPKESRKKSIPKKYAVYSVYDRDDADPEWYWVKWNGYRDDAHDTAQHRSHLETDGFGKLCDHVDAYKEWEAEGDEGEIRLFEDYCKLHPVRFLPVSYFIFRVLMVYCTVQISREYTNDSEALCYVASLRRVGELLGLDNYLPEVVLQRFFRKHPACERSGVTWQNLTKLMQQCNSFQKKLKKIGIEFRGRRSGTNLVRTKISGHLDLAQIRTEPGVYLCGVSTASTGHMFVIHVLTDSTVTVYDSAENTSRQFDDGDFSWVVRWKFIHQCFVGHF